MKAMIKVMKAFSDPSRVRILKLLQIRELCVCEIVELLGLAQSTVSKHLKLLDEAELVSSRREGMWMIYSLHQNPANRYGKTMLTNLSTWVDDDQVLMEMIQRLNSLKRDGLPPVICNLPDSEVRV